MGQSEHDKALHRHTMGHMLLANQHFQSQAYQLEPVLAALNFNVRFPHIALFRKLALNFARLQTPELPDLAGLIADELFYFGFAYPGMPVGTTPGPNNPPPPPDLHMWMPYLKNETCVQLSLLCRAVPAIAARFVRLSAQNLGSINPQQVSNAVLLFHINTKFYR